MTVLEGSAGVLAAACLAYSLVRGIFVSVQVDTGKEDVFQVAAQFAIATYWAVVAIFFLLVVALM